MDVQPPRTISGSRPAEAGCAACVPVPELCCDCCSRPRHVVTADGTVGCHRPACSAAGIDVPLWHVIDRATAAGRPDQNPRGRRRPILGGRPVPWVTPVTSAARPIWRALHRGRLARCQTEWACQLCGEPLEEAAALITYSNGTCPTSAAAHPGCARLATAVCPHLASAEAIRLHHITHADITITGEVWPELGQTQRWRIVETPEPPHRLNSSR